MCVALVVPTAKWWRPVALCRRCSLRNRGPGKAHKSWPGAQAPEFHMLWSLGNNLIMSASQTATGELPNHALGEPVLELLHVNKSYELEGGVRLPALKDVCLCVGSEFDAVRKGEFVMVRRREPPQPQPPPIGICIPPSPPRGARLVCVWGGGLTWRGCAPGVSRGGQVVSRFA